MSQKQLTAASEGRAASMRDGSDHVLQILFLHAVQLLIGVRIYINKYAYMICIYLYNYVYANIKVCTCMRENDAFPFLLLHTAQILIYV